MSNITTPGALLIKHMLPTQEAKDHFDIYSPLNKGGMSKLVNNLIQHGGEDAHTTINDLGKMFFNKATEIGATTPLSDYLNDSDDRKAIFAEVEHKVSEVLKQNHSKQEQNALIGQIVADASKVLSKQNVEYLVERGSTAAKMAKTGARGNPSQLQQGTASPIMGADIGGNPIPVVIKHSFAEGLSNAEHLAMSYGGRASTVLAQLSTEKPGALFKRLTPAVYHEVVTETDCGTKNGIYIKTSDRTSCLGRYEAGTNKLIDEVYLKELRASGTEQIKARNPMTCEAKEGLCQKCYGLAANGKVPEIGRNMGVIAAQSVSEVLTQAMLSTKHQGGTAGRSRNPYDEASNLLNNPSENFQDQATISQKNGIVTDIKKTALNDHEVYVDGSKHFVDRLQDVVVKVGDKLKIGDAISTGTINPRQLVSLKGAGAGRVYIANKMREIYSRNALLDPRHFDVIARNMIKHYEVEDPGHSGFLPGDKVEVGRLSQHMAEHSKQVDPDSSVGHILAKGVLELTPGTIMTENHAEYLKQHGIDKVSVDTSGLKLSPIVPGLQTNKLLDKNWVSRLAFSNLGKSLQEAAALGQKSQIHSIDPITPYTIGNEFGEGTNGKY